eukprot:Ihof_evm1s58 gene=Ihof_evmTU1s58
MASYDRQSINSWSQQGNGWERQSNASERLSEAQYYRTPPVQVDPNQGLKMCVVTMRGIINDMRNISATLKGTESEAFTRWRHNYAIGKNADLVASRRIQGLKDTGAEAHLANCQNQIQLLARHVAQRQSQIQDEIERLQTMLSRQQHRHEEEIRLDSNEQKQVTQQRVDELTKEREQLADELDKLNTAIVHGTQLKDSPETLKAIENEYAQLQMSHDYLTALIGQIQGPNGTPSPTEASMLKQNIAKEVDRLKNERDTKLLYAFDAVTDAKEALITQWQGVLKSCDQALKEEKLAKAAIQDSAKKLE